MEDTQIDSLRKLLADAYGMLEPEVALIRTGGDGNQTFKVTAGGVPFIARVYGRQAQANPGFAQYELELLAHLADSGVAVAAPVRCRDRAWTCLLATSGAAPSPVALFCFADGGVEWPTAAPRAHLLGASFAKLHRAADSFQTAVAPRAGSISTACFMLPWAGYARI